MSTSTHGEPVGIVVIGRNEGDRLVACLRSLGAGISRTVYVDSGSSDDSVERAQALGATVVLLNPNQPFTAARARNAGFERLIADFPAVSMVQFLDGDCVLDSDWIANARTFLGAHDEIALVCGRRRERYPQRSIYNQLCDWEWDTPIGEATECGGDCLVRVAAFAAIGGYAGALIAGEEPDMCVRLRESGWLIWRLDAEMSLHDANIQYFSQWWRRSVRAGHAFAEVALRHKASPTGIWRGNGRRAVIWGLVLPLLVGLVGLLVHPALLLLLGIYPLQIARIGARDQQRGWAYAVFTVMGKFPEAQGVLQFYYNRLVHRRAKLIEYK